MPERLGRRGYAVSMSPAGTEQDLSALIPPTFGLLLQTGDAFGQVLFGAVRGLLAAGHDCVLLINGDSPTLPSAFLGEAIELLRRPGDRAVLGPATDGGYYLIGLKRAHPRLFEDIVWGTETVAQLTRERASEIGLPMAELPEWYDIDDAEAFSWLTEELAGRSECFRNGGPAAATQACRNVRRWRTMTAAGETSAFYKLCGLGAVLAILTLLTPIAFETWGDNAYIAITVPPAEEHIRRHAHCRPGTARRAMGDLASRNGATARCCCSSRCSPPTSIATSGTAGCRAPASIRIAMCRPTPRWALCGMPTIYPNINRADYAPTAYPPVAQIFFFLVTRLTETLTGMRLGPHRLRGGDRRPADATCCAPCACR